MKLQKVAANGRISTTLRYMRRWAPFWGHCILTGTALGFTLGVFILAVSWPYVAPVWVVVLAASLRHLHATRGTRVLTTTARKAYSADGTRPGFPTGERQGDTWRRSSGEN